MGKIIRCEKLSKLQRLVLVMLSEPRLAVEKRREFNFKARAFYWGKDSRSTRASLLRAMRRLEDRNCVRRCKGSWMLTEAPAGESGVELAFLAWARDPVFYAERYGLNGPPQETLEALGIKGKAPVRPGVRVELNCEE